MNVRRFAEILLRAAEEAAGCATRICIGPTRVEDDAGTALAAPPGSGWAPTLPSSGAIVFSIQSPLRAI